MITPWLVLIIEILLFYPFKHLINDTELLAVVVIFLNIPFVIFLFYRYGKEAFFVFLTGLFLRIIVMFWDIYGRDFFYLPHSGNDSEGFLNSALTISENIFLLNEDIYGGLYSKVLGVIFYFGPADRILVQYINVLLGVTTILLAYKIMTLLNIDKKIKMWLLILMIIFPSSLIFSGILLREAIIAFTVVLSFYYFLKWMMNGSFYYVIYSIIILIISASFHSGVLGILLGYLFMLLFYRPKHKRFKTSVQSVVVFIISITVMVVLNSISLENLPFLDKFTHSLDSIDDLYDVSSSGRGGSVYLQGLSINNPIQLILLAPIKMFYFLGSPLPLNWRGISDITSFLYDGIIYLALFLYPTFNYRRFIKGDPVAIGIFIMLLGTIFIFGVGLNNAGTAMRHRYKIFYIIIIFFGVTLKNKNIKQK